MNKVTIIVDPFAPEGDKKTSTHECEHIGEFLKTQFTKFPDDALIYHEKIAPENDVTPRDSVGIERLFKLKGSFFVVLYPGGIDPFTIAIIFIVSFAVTKLLSPKPPVIPAARNVDGGSPNNELSSRSNRPRINGRIPDIFGEQISTPDLIALPYTNYENNKEVEYSYMCIGRGEYDIAAGDVRDNTTKISEIDDATVEIYAPFTSPNSIDDPQLTIGTPINIPVLYTDRTEAVNGQTLVAPNETPLVSSLVEFIGPNKIKVNDVGIDLTTLGYAPAGTVKVTHGMWIHGFTFIGFSGSYTMSAVTANTITLSDPSSAWAALEADLGSGASTADAGGLSPASVTLETTSVTDTWVGPFQLEVAAMSNFMANFVAPQGMFKDDGTTQYAVDVEVQVGLLPTDAGGTPTGTERFYTTTINGSATERSLRGKTLTAPADDTFGYCKVRARRLTARDTSFSGTVVDEVRWRDLYAVAPVNQNDFGNVTTVQSRTVATIGALQVKERRLNIKCTRKIKPITAPTSSTHTIGSTTAPSKDAGQIFINACLDPYIGGRTEDEINFYEILTQFAAATTLFGTGKCTEFSYTFDKDNISFEETANAIANAAFCQAFRRGNTLTVGLEKAQTASKLSFNHRNKIPKSEKRAITFGNRNDSDGIEFAWVDPADQSSQTFYLPYDRSAVKPEKIESFGVRNRIQAYMHAWRAYNKLIYQRMTVEFEATQEAELLLENDRILVANNVRPHTQDGEVLGKVGLVITTSQPVAFGEGDYVVALQLTDGTVQMIGATPGANEYEITLDAEPSLALSLNPSNFALATYILVESSNAEAMAFLVSERDRASQFTSTVKAFNYDGRYYEHDNDVIGGIVNDEGFDSIATARDFTGGGSVTLKADGTALSATDDYWAYPTPTAGIGARFWYRLTRTGGTTGVGFSPSSGVWRSMSTDQLVTASGGVGGATGTVEFASDSSGVHIVATDTIEANNSL
jgi:hypothetical protein